MGTGYTSFRNTNRYVRPHNDKLVLNTICIRFDLIQLKGVLLHLRKQDGALNSVERRLTFESDSCFFQDGGRPPDVQLRYKNTSIIK